MDYFIFQWKLTLINRNINLRILCLVSIVIIFIIFYYDENKNARNSGNDILLFNETNLLIESDIRKKRLK